MMTLRPFFCFFGGKWRAVPKYPRPEHSHIVESFAGGAGYATRYHDRRITLYEIDPIVFGVWDYLVHTSASEIGKLPVRVDHVDNLKVCQEARWLIGFWLNPGTASPRKQRSAWAKQWSVEHPNCFWGDSIRSRIASQVDQIRHWKVLNESFETAPSAEVTWFVDPPYQNPCGRNYRFNDVDYGALAQWCRGRRGQVIACEQHGATWLPFKPFTLIKGSSSPHRKNTHSKEVIWTNAT